MKAARLIQICSLFLVITICHTATAQSVGINTDGSAPHSSAILDLKSSSKGLLVPRLTGAQKNNIASPATGLLVYQTDSAKGFFYNKGTSANPNWTALGATATPGVVQSYYTAGNTAYPSSTLSFITPVITITITEGQKVFLTATRALGGYAPANELGIYPACQSTVAGSPIINLNLGMFGLQVPANTRITFSVNGVFNNLPAGTYKFGMSGVTSSPNWTNCEWGYVSALVF